MPQRSARSSVFQAESGTPGTIFGLLRAACVEVYSSVNGEDRPLSIVARGRGEGGQISECLRVSVNQAPSHLG